MCWTKLVLHCNLPCCVSGGVLCDETETENSENASVSLKNTDNDTVL